MGPSLLVVTSPAPESTTMLVPEVVTPNAAKATCKQPKNDRSDNRGSILTKDWEPGRRTNSPRSVLIYSLRVGSLCLLCRHCHELDEMKVCRRRTDTPEAR